MLPIALFSTLLTLIPEVHHFTALLRGHFESRNTLARPGRIVSLAPPKPFNQERGFYLACGRTQEILDKAYTGLAIPYHDLYKVANRGTLSLCRGLCYLYFILEAEISVALFFPCLTEEE